MNIYDKSFSDTRGLVFDPILHWVLDRVHPFTTDLTYEEAIIALPPSPLRTVAVVAMYDDIFHRESLPGFFVKDRNGFGQYAVSAYREINADYHAELLECLFRKYPFLASPQLQPEDTRYEFYELAYQEGTPESIDIEQFTVSYFGQFEQLAECLKIYINTHFGESL